MLVILTQINFIKLILQIRRNIVQRRDITIAFKVVQVVFVFIQHVNEIGVKIDEVIRSRPITSITKGPA